MGTKISSIEYVFGEKEINNDYFKSDFKHYNFDKFEKKVGIKKRYRASQNEDSLSLALNAINKLINSTKINRENIQYLIFCSQTPRYILPTSACVIQSESGLRNDIGALDINLGCSGFTSGLSLAKGLIESGQVENVLLVTAETYSKLIHPYDLINNLIFSDAASATLIEKSEVNMIGEFCFGTDGSGYDKLIIKNNFLTKDEYPKLKEVNDFIKFTDNHLFMDGPAIFNFTLDTLPKVISDILNINNTEINKIDNFVLHQANKFLVKKVCKISKIPEEKIYFDIDNIGNTVSNTIPIALKNNRIKNNFDKNQLQSHLIAGFGVGLSLSGTIIKF